MQREFTIPFEEMFPQELNKQLQKLYLSVRLEPLRGTYRGPVGDGIA